MEDPDMTLPVYESVCYGFGGHPEISPEDLAVLNDPFAVIPTEDALEESEAE
jgi:hypothetical protein